MKTLHATGILTLLVTLFPLVPSVHAQVSESACRARVTAALTQVSDDYRSHLFGSILDNDNLKTVKTGGITDEVRTGIFEHRERLTSEFINPLVESYRAYRCNSLLICQNLLLSMDARSSAQQAVRIPGCVERQMEPYPQCNAENNAIKDKRVLLSFCSTTVNSSLLFERNILKMAVAYDAGYRADVLQLPGMVEWMVKDMSTRNFLPLRGMVNLLGKLHQIPCFIGQCDMPNNDDLTLP